MLSSFLLFSLPLLIIINFFAKIEAVKCHDCVGINCTGQICEGDYCVSGHYLPKWGFFLEWIETKIVKGCMSGKMLKSDIQSQCETTFHQNGMKKSTCFCNSEDFCNGEKESEKHEIQDILLFTCICKGEHCKSPKCVGELCSYVINQKSGEYEQGCVNSSMPLIERRFAGSCMIPPATGAMHHWVSKNAIDLAYTESCLCVGDNCNADKPKYDVEKEKMKCDAFIRANIFGTKMISQNVTCIGEYCFTIDIDSELGLLRSFNTAGCMTFIEGAELAEELNPVGCAKFHSENLEVKSCLNVSFERTKNKVI
uniref:Sodefrin-like factor n=1 Tax=Panagrolaimus davidi TaxID=227884 RepID=A0A914P5R3_9BILA